MVARDMPPSDPLKRALDALARGVLALFDAWRRLLARTTRRFSSGAAGLPSFSPSRWKAQWPSIAGYLRRPRRAWEIGSLRALEAPAAFGVRAFLFGLAGGAAVALWTGTSPRLAALAAASEVVWLLARWAILAMLLPRDTVGRDRLATAYLAGLTPYLIALTPTLRVVALILSAILTLSGLDGAGVPRKNARVAGAFAFGGQLAVGVLSWLGRAVLAGLGL